MKKRKVKSDNFPPATGPIKWLSQYDVFTLYRQYGVTKKFLAYNRSAKFRNGKLTTNEDILLCKRTGAAGVSYRSDITKKFVIRTFGTDNIINIEQSDNLTTETPPTHNTKSTKANIGQKS